jgi:hypothetical protein
MTFYIEKPPNIISISPTPSHQQYNHLSRAMRPAPSPSASMPIWTAPPPPSPWHSPVPYLFGGLAAMLGLIALALLILACSYWKVNRYLLDTAECSGPDGEGSKSPPVADLVAVVMAGEKTPRFLAAPVIRHAVVENSGKAVVDGESGTERAGRQQTDHV